MTVIASVRYSGMAKCIVKITIISMSLLAAKDFYSISTQKKRLIDIFDDSCVIAKNYSRYGSKYTFLSIGISSYLLLPLVDNNMCTSFTVFTCLHFCSQLCLIFK